MSESYGGKSTNTTAVLRAERKSQRKRLEIIELRALNSRKIFFQEYLIGLWRYLRTRHGNKILSFLESLLTSLFR